MLAAIAADKTQSTVVISIIRYIFIQADAAMKSATDSKQGAVMRHAKNENTPTMKNYYKFIFILTVFVHSCNSNKNKIDETKALQGHYKYSKD